MFLEGGSLLKLEKILALFPCSQSRSFTGFLDKVTMKEVWTDGHQQSKAARHREGLKDWVAQTSRRRSTSPHGKERDMDRRNRRRPQGEEITKTWAFVPYHSKTAFFFSSQQKFNGEQSFSMGFCVGWSIDWEARELSGPQRSNKVERMSGAQERSDKVERSANVRATPGWTASLYL